MNDYTSNTVEFLILVLTSGMIAASALAIASAIGFTVAFVLYRDRAAAAAPAEARAAMPTAEIGSRGVSQAAPAFALKSAAASAG